MGVAVARVHRGRLVAVLVVAVLLAVLLLAPRVRRFLAVDACLDAGGRYDYERDICVGARD